MMKKLLFLIGLCLCTLAFSQTTDNQKPIIATKAEFPGGDTAFRKEFMRMVHAYVDTKIYAVNGLFTFNITIDENGKMSLLNVLPMVKNSAEFRKDMEFAIKRIKKKWKPATENGVPVKSTKIFKINFTTDYF